MTLLHLSYCSLLLGPIINAAIAATHHHQSVPHVFLPLGSGLLTGGALTLVLFFLASKAALVIRSQNSNETFSRGNAGFRSLWVWIAMVRMLNFD